VPFRRVQFANNSLAFGLNRPGLSGRCLDVPGIAHYGEA
jgi:hypothetical protein